MMDIEKYLERFYANFAARKDLTRLTEPVETDIYTYSALQPGSYMSLFDNEFFEPVMESIAKGLLEFDDGEYHTLKIFIVEDPEKSGDDATCLICLTASRGTAPLKVEW